MPTYEYQCKVCNIAIEFQRGFGENREPSCCGEIMTRLWSSPGILFNGPGFYSTDNRK
jgi:putative FmdB family regulatory protein